MQKRGKILVGEDVRPLQETYPLHPLTKEPRRHEDKKDMLRKRKSAIVKLIEAEQKLWEEANPYFIERKWLKPEGYTENP